MKEFGKKFEQDLGKSCELAGIFSYRIKTRHTQYRGDNEIADYLVYVSPNLFVLELKSTKEKRLPFDMIRLNQITGLIDVAKFGGVYAGILVQFREPEYSHWYIPIEVIEEYIKGDRKSIPIKECQDDPRIIEIPFTKKRVSVLLDVRGFVDKITKGGH